MEVVCKNCPVGCHLVVKDGEVYGNKCARGLSYRNYEKKSIFYTQVNVINSSKGHLSVKSDREIDESEKEECKELLKSITLEPPIGANEVVIENLGNTGINFISQRKISN